MADPEAVAKVRRGACGRRAGGGGRPLRGPGCAVLLVNGVNGNWLLGTEAAGVRAGIRGALLQHVRHQPGAAGAAVSGALDADVRGAADAGLPEHRAEADHSAVPAVQAPCVVPGCPALGLRRHPRLCNGTAVGTASQTR